MTAEARLESSHVNVRIKISALWTSMLFVFAYVDLFSLYRPDVRADLEGGELGGFTVNQTFVLGTTVYVVIPSLMVFCALILRPRVNRIVNIALAIVYALTISDPCAGRRQCAPAPVDFQGLPRTPARPLGNARKPAWLAGLRPTERRGRDLNPRSA